MFKPFRELLIIGDALYSDNYGILLLNEEQDVLTPHFSYRGTDIENVGVSLPISKGISGKVVSTRRSIRANDVSLDTSYFEVTGNTRSELCVPIISGSKVFGALNVESNKPDIFTEKDERLLNTIAGGLANALERIQLFEAEKKRSESAETLMRAATELTNLLDLPSLHNAILEWLYKIAPYDSASILEIEGGHIRITAAKGLPNPEKVLNKIFSSSNILCKTINETGQALIIDDCRQDVRFENWADSQHVRGWMGVPLISRGQVIGYLTIDSHSPHAFSQDDAVITQTFAHQAATSLENTRLYIETRQRLDELEMVNRVSFALRAAKDTHEMLPILLNEIQASIESDTATILLYDPEIDALKPHATSGWLASLPKTTFKPGEGIIGKVYTSGVTHVSPEFINDPIAHTENANFFGKGWGGVAVPIRTASETIGVIMVGIPNPRQVEFHHVRLITTLADIAGNAIYRSSLFQKNEEQIRRLTTLREMDTAITSSLDLHITLDILTEHLTTKMGVNAARILVYNPNSQMLDNFTAAGFMNPASSRQPIGIGDGLTSQILLSRKELFIKNIEDETNLLPDYLSNEGFKSYYAIPLFSKGSTRGVIETYFRDTFTPTTDWKDFLKTLAGQATIAIDNAQLFENLQRSNQELSLAYDTTLEGWGKALELRDKETQGHTQRVTNLTLKLARQMGIPESEITHIRRGALLHDIGKMGVPDSILHKPGALTDEEIADMRKHPQYAYDLLSPITYLRPTLDIPYCHHEWWDGNGYPRKLKGEEIPLSARIFAIIDVWDALLSDRPYRDAWPEADVMKYIAGLSGKQFDPQVVNEFKKLIGAKSNFIHPAPQKTRKAAKKKK
ncbi:MAG: GAF domain-containing protein [Chloroflexi bacterium]|nr:GAF domain-containing protein [Chloroflexota bacterium]